MGERMKVLLKRVCATRNADSASWCRLERVAKLALLAQEKLWGVETELTWGIPLDPNAHMRISPPALDEALGAILSFFKPQPDTDEVQRHLYLRLSYSNNLSIEAASLLDHERLEAALEWRDWLTTHCHG